MFASLRNLVGMSSNPPTVQSNHPQPVQQPNLNPQVQIDQIKGLRIALQHAMERPVINAHEISTIQTEIDGLVQRLTAENPLVIALLDLTDASAQADAVKATMSPKAVMPQDWTSIRDRIANFYNNCPRPATVSNIMIDNGVWFRIIGDTNRKAPSDVTSYAHLINHLATIGHCSPDSFMLVYKGSPVSPDFPVVRQNEDGIDVVIRAPRNLQ